MNSGGNSEPRVLIVDIENEPYTVYTWDNNPRTPISHENIVKSAQMICAAWSWEGSDKVYSKIVPIGGDDKELAKELQRVIGLADAVVAHFGDGHDIPWISARCLYHNLGPLKPVIQIDTWKIARSKFKLYNNKLAYLAKFLGVAQKLETTFDLWREVMAGSKRARREMLKYNRGDIVTLKAVWARIKPFAVAKLNRAMYVSDHLLGQRTCPACGEPKLRRHGTQYTRTGLRYRLFCTACKHWCYRLTHSRAR